MNHKFKVGERVTVGCYLGEFTVVEIIYSELLLKNYYAVKSDFDNSFVGLAIENNMAVI